VTANLEPLEEGSYTVTAVNASAPDGVKLIGLAFHVTVDDPTVIDILGSDDPAGFHTTRVNASPTSDPVVNGTVAPNGQMCVFFNGDSGVLDVGDSKPLELQYKAKKKGQTSIKCHIHATIEESTIFPSNHAGAGDDHTVKVLA
jgi:hypothetical protein